MRQQQKAAWTVRQREEVQATGLTNPRSQRALAACYSVQLRPRPERLTAFTRPCQNRDIRPARIPLARPWRKGFRERSNRPDKEELFFPHCFPPTRSGPTIWPGGNWRMIRADPSRALTSKRPSSGAPKFIPFSPLPVR